MSLKIKKLFLNNFDKFTEFTIEFGNSVTRLIGLNGAGKSTVGCTAIWAGLKGIAEKSTNGQLIGERYRFISPNARSADISIELQDEQTGEVITCTNKMTKDANKITLVSSLGRQLTDDWMSKLFSVVFMSAKNFCALSSKDQALQLGIDVSKIDTEIKELKSEFTALNRELKAFGALEEVANVEVVDVGVLKLEREALRLILNGKYLDNVEVNKKLRLAHNEAVEKEREFVVKHNREQSELTIKRNVTSDAMDTLFSLGYVGNDLDVWFKSLPIPQAQITELKTVEPEYPEPRPDDTDLKEIDQKVADAYETNKKADVYKIYLKKTELKAVKQKEVDDNSETQKTKEKERLGAINNHKFPFNGVSIDENGGLLLSGRPIKEPYFSKGELELIVANIASHINSEWKTRFIDDFDLLDEANQAKLIKTLTERGYQVIVAEVGTKSDKDGSIVLRECKLDAGNPDAMISLL